MAIRLICTEKRHEPMCNVHQYKYKIKTTIMVLSPITIHTGSELNAKVSTTLSIYMY